YSRCLCSNERLEIHEVEHRRFQQMRFKYAGFHTKERFIRKDDRAFLHAPQAARKSKGAQLVIEGRIVILLLLLQIGDHLLIEMERLHILHDTLQSCKHRISIAKRQLSKIKFENRLII